MPSDPNKQKLKYLNSGEEYFKRGEYQAAVIQLGNALQLDPHFAEAHYQLGLTYMRLSNRSAALNEFRQTVALQPGNSDAQLQLGSLFLASHQYGQAQAAMNQVLKADPNSAKAHAALGENYAATHDTEHAILELQKAIELDPAGVEYYISLAALRQALGERKPPKRYTRTQSSRTRNPSQLALVSANSILHKESYPRPRLKMLAASQTRSACRISPTPSCAHICGNGQVVRRGEGRR